MYWWGGPMSGWGYALMALSSIAFWALLILGIVVLVRMARSGRGADPAGIDRPTPEQLLAERYARGEIDDDEYHHRLNILVGPTPASPKP